MMVIKNKPKVSNLSRIKVLMVILLVSFASCRSGSNSVNPNEPSQVAQNNINEDKDANLEKQSSLPYQVLWKFQGDSHSMDDIAYAQNKVFIGFQGRAFYALDESTGDVLWEFSDGFTRSIEPVANEDVVCFGSWDFHVLRSNDGEPLWSIRSNDGSSWVHSLIQKDTLYVAQGGEIRMTDRDYLHAFETFTGKETWKFQVKGSINAPPVLAHGLIYFGTFDGWFYALEANTGKEKWKTKLPYSISSSPAVDDTRVYVLGAKPNEGYLYALDAFTGKEHWKFGSTQNCGFDSTSKVSPLIHNGILYFAGGLLYAIDPGSGKEIWSYPANEKRWLNSFTIANDQVYIGAHELHVLDAKTGALKWNFNQGMTTFVTKTLISHDKIFFRDSDGTLYAIQEK